MHTGAKRSQGSRKGRRKAFPLQAVLKTVSLALAAVAVLYLGNRVMSIELPEVLPVEQVEVAGDLRYIDRSEVRKIIVANIDGGYFTVDLVGIREQLLQQPWIKDVAIRRQWPAGLLVSIEEQQPLAYWNDRAYINQDGEIFRPKHVDSSLDLPKLNGPAGQQEKVWKFMNRLYREMALLDLDVVRLELDRRRAWQMQIVEPGAGSAPVTIRLGRFDTEKRLRRFITVLPALMRNTENGGGIEYIDMRYPNGFAVKMIKNNTENTTGPAAPGLMAVSRAGAASFNTNSRLAAGGMAAAGREGEA